MEKLEYLICYLLEERNESKIEIPKKEEDKKRLYRALVNTREPLEISDDFLKIEDEYLQEELLKKEIIDVRDIESVSEVYGHSSIQNADKICLWKDDITKLKIDAIVNAANSEGLGCFVPNHNCIDNQIHTFAGVRLRLECLKKMQEIGGKLHTGNAFMTQGYNLPSSYVIHTVGPIIDRTVTSEDEELLANCYKNSLKLAAKNHIKTIAFPCISTGIFSFPSDRACQIALHTVDEFLSENRESIEKVVFNAFLEKDLFIYEEAMHI